MKRCGVCGHEHEVWQAHVFGTPEERRQLADIEALRGDPEGLKPRSTNIDTCPVCGADHSLVADAEKWRAIREKQRLRMRKRRKK